MNMTPGVFFSGGGGSPGARGRDGAPGAAGQDGMSFRWRGNWQRDQYYLLGDVVGFDGSSYISIEVNSGVFPTDPKYWTVLARKGNPGSGGSGGAGTPGPTGATGATGPAGANGLSFVWRGAWDNALTYALNEVVSFSGSSYIAIQVHSGQQPDVAPTYWSLMAQKGAAGAAGAAGSAGATGATGPDPVNVVAEKFTYANGTLASVSSGVWVDTANMAFTSGVAGMPVLSNALSESLFGERAVKLATAPVITSSNLLAYCISYDIKFVQLLTGWQCGILFRINDAAPTTTGWNLRFQINSSGGGSIGVLKHGVFNIPSVAVPNGTITADTVFKFKLVVVGNIAEGYINGVRLCSTLMDATDAAFTGCGIQVSIGTNGSANTYVVDNFNVAVPLGTSFLWQGAWVSGQAYAINDVVSNSGSSYVCILETAGATVPGSDATHWSVMAAIGATGSTGPAGPSFLTTKGDMLGHDGTNTVRVGVGSNLQLVRAASTATAGFEWFTPSWNTDNLELDPIQGIGSRSNIASAGGTSKALVNLGWRQDTADPSATNQGRAYFNTTQDCPKYFGTFGKASIGGLVIEDHTSFTYTGNVVTTIGSNYTFPANSLKVGKILRFHFWGVYAAGVASTTLKFDVNLGGANLTFGATAATAGSKTWYVRGFIQLRAVGGTPTASLTGQMDRYMENTYTPAIATITTGFDTTIANLFKVTSAFSQPGVGNTLTHSGSYLEILN